MNLLKAESPLWLVADEEVREMWSSRKIQQSYYCSEDEGATYKDQRAVRLTTSKKTGTSVLQPEEPNFANNQNGLGSGVFPQSLQIRTQSSPHFHFSLSKEPSQSASCQTCVNLLSSNRKWIPPSPPLWRPQWPGISKASIGFSSSDAAWPNS